MERLKDQERRFHDLVGKIILKTLDVSPSPSKHAEEGIKKFDTLDELVSYHTMKMMKIWENIFLDRSDPNNVYFTSSQSIEEDKNLFFRCACDHEGDKYSYGTNDMDECNDMITHVYISLLNDLKIHPDDWMYFDQIVIEGLFEIFLSVFIEPIISEIYPKEISKIITSFL